MAQKRYRRMMLLILLLQAVSVLYWGNRKESYYIDELWSYGLSNSYYEPFLQNKADYMSRWHTPDFYESYLVVGKEETFSYNSVYYNQGQDVHPPLYYLLLHTICSLFPGKFSKWSGIFVNLLFYSGAVWLLYEISGQIMGKDNSKRLVPPLLYGFSGGALSTVMYIRMYMALTFWTLLLVFLTFWAVEDEKKARLLWFGIAGTITAGFLTQYYFLIFAFFLSAGYVLWRVYIRQWKKAVIYASAVLSGIGAEIMLFPASLTHILAGEKGKDSFSNISQGLGVFLERLRQYDEIISKQFWGARRGMDIIFWGIFLAGIFLMIRRGSKQG